MYFLIESVPISQKIIVYVAQISKLKFWCMCLIAIIVHIYDNDVLNCDNLYTSHVDDIFTHFVSLMKVLGWKTILLDTPTRWEGEKTIKNVSKDQIWLYENTLFCVFWKFPIVTILIDKFLHENSIYRKNGAYHDAGNGKSKKSVISDFLFLNFRHRDFSI